MTGEEGHGRVAAWLGLAAVLVAALLAGRTLVEPGFYDSHDGLLNVHRLFELEKCIEDGPVPCRWAPDMGYGYGTPLFVFYPPFATYLSFAFRAIGASHLDAVKLSMLASLVVGALGMYGLARRFYGPTGATLAAVLFTWAPYRAVDVFARGALAEAWGIAWLPLVFLTGERAMSSRENAWPWSLACAGAWCALLLTHNLTTLMAAPAYAAWCLLWLTTGARSGRPRTWRSLAPFALGHLLGFALAGWYVLPSLLEQGDAHTGTLSTLYAWARYENNFLTFSELFLGTTPWGYGAFRQPGGISLFAGGLQWGLALAAALGTTAALARRRDLDRASRAALLLALAGGAAAWMTAGASKPVWDAVPPLAFLQFPWRFLAVAGFGFSFAAGWLASRPSGPTWLAPAFAALVVALAVGTGWSRFAPSQMLPVESRALANARAVANARHGLFDFLPIGVDLDAVPKRPPARRPAAVEPLHAATVVANVRRSSHAVAFEADVRGDAPGAARVNVFDFPGWTLRVDGALTTPAPFPDPLGRLHVALPPGRHTVEARFERTPVRSFAEGLSVLALICAAAWGAAILRARRFRAD